jgi:hypothetical protein
MKPIILLLLGACILACTETGSTPPRTSPSAAMDAGSVFPPAVEAAKRQLIQFRTLDAGAQEEALKVLDGFEQPERYEEHGMADGRPYYYARLRYEKVGITVHSDGERVTNVEQNEHQP